MCAAVHCSQTKIELVLQPFGKAFWLNKEQGVQTVRPLYPEELLPGSQKIHTFTFFSKHNCMKNFISVLRMLFIIFYFGSTIKASIKPRRSCKVAGCGKSTGFAGMAIGLHIEFNFYWIQRDETNADIWMVSWDGKQNVQLKNSDEDETFSKSGP